MKKNIGFVFLDLGRVLFHLDYRTFLDNLMEFTSLPIDHVKDTMMWNGLNIEFETGAIGEKTYFQEIRKQIEFSGTRENFFEIWNTILLPIHENINFAKELSSEYSIGIISNTNESHVLHMEETAGLKDLTEHRFYSNRIGYMKPRAEIFETALKETKMKAEQTVFIDDREDHIQAAKELGMNAYVFPVGENLKSFWQEVVVPGLS